MSASNATTRSTFGMCGWSESLKNKKRTERETHTLCKPDLQKAASMIHVESQVSVTIPLRDVDRGPSELYQRDNITQIAGPTVMFSTGTCFAAFRTFLAIQVDAILGTEQKAGTL